MFDPAVVYERGFGTGEYVDWYVETCDWHPRVFACQEGYVCVIVYIVWRRMLDRGFDAHFRNGGVKNQNQLFFFFSKRGRLIKILPLTLPFFCLFSFGLYRFCIARSLGHLGFFLRISRVPYVEFVWLQR